MSRGKKNVEAEYQFSMEVTQGWIIAHSWWAKGIPGMVWQYVDVECLKTKKVHRDTCLVSLY
jgi:hypothetical protein